MLMIDSGSVELVGLLGIEIKQDGDQWFLIWGSNIQEGVCGFGDTPAQAVKAFSIAFFEERILLPETP
tara:strand:+ start:112 stop:315 length:204 start_codon:yes stop_codon:yes gene_type:complete